MKIFLDASFLVYLNVDIAEAEKIDDLFESLLKEDLYTDVLVLDEVRCVWMLLTTSNGIS